jgi:histidinol phosphatase-like PHP family hydrolase
LPEIDTDSGDKAEILAQWFGHNEELLATGIDILGHPFRWLYNAAHITASKSVILRLMALAGKNKVAMEINGHDRIPGDEEILRAAPGLDVKITFGSDSHKREEIGNLDYQFGLLEKLGMKLDDVPFWVPGH